MVINRPGWIQVGTLFVIKKRVVAVLRDPNRHTIHYVVETFNRDGSPSKRQIRQLWESDWDNLRDTIVAIRSLGGQIYDGR